MTKPPSTYAEWMPLFDKLATATDDSSVLPLLQQGTIAWQSGVAERFATRFAEMLNARLDRATDAFQRANQHAHGEREIIEALLKLRKDLHLLLELTHIPALPPEQQQAYRDLVQQQADTIQQSLMDSSRSDRTGKLTSIIRNHPVNR